MAMLIFLLGLLFCYADAGREDLEIIRNKRADWSLGGSYGKTGGRDHWGANVGYKKGGFSSGVNYQGTKGYHKVGGNIGYQNDRFSVKGTGFRDTTGNWGAGVSLGWRFRRSSSKPIDAFYLRVEADPCQFILYDRNGDDVITIEELEEVFPDRNLAEGLFQRLDIEEKGKISREEFEAAKASGAIIGCAVPAERILDEADLKN